MPRPSQLLTYGTPLLCGLVLLFAGPAGSAPTQEPTGWTNAECMDCHPKQTRRWRTSRHASSFDNLHFQTAWTEARHRGWCLECHQPEGEPSVTCTSCHTDHDAPADDVCATCHEFVGPSVAGPFELGGAPLQATFTEWRDTPAGRAGESCASCHLAGHRFRGAHDKALVRSALDIQAEPDALHLQTTDALGHRLPTGDPFRRVEIELCADKACEKPVASAVLAVLHVADDDGFLRVSRDTRLGPPGGNAPDHLRVPRPDTARFWRVTLVLADPTLVLPDEERFLPIASGDFP